jgi:hypothetical protein
MRRSPSFSKVVAEATVSLLAATAPGSAAAATMAAPPMSTLRREGAVFSLEFTFVTFSFLSAAKRSYSIELHFQKIVLSELRLTIA